MNLAFKNLQLRQGNFLLEIDAEITARTLGIFGPSGAGKTSLLEIVAGLRRPTSGCVELDGEPMPPPRAQPRRVGYVPQDLALFPHLSVRQNITYGYDPVTSSPGLTVDHVAHVLEITPLLDRSIPQLSGGQKQRVAFARALLASPRLLLLDEPLASLDHDLKLKLIPYLQRLRDEFQIPLLYVSHSPAEIAALCDQVLVLNQGKCLRLTPPAALFEPAPSLQLRPGIII